jgi:two-component system sensor histidine kinase DesK
MRTDSVAGLPIWTHGRARLALVLVHIPVFAVLPINVLQSYVGGALTAPVMAAGLALAVALAALQMRTGLAVAQYGRPSHVPATVAAVVVIAVLLLFLIGWWGPFALVFVAATVLLLLPLPAGVMACAAVLIENIWWAFFSDADGPENFPARIEGFVYNVIIYSVTVACLVGSVRLVRLLDELHASRAELAEMSVTAERLRIARDLHDLLGQSLSAVSLKGDLAAMLLDRDRAAARAEIESLTDTARAALRNVRAVASAPEKVRLWTELDNASTLLGAAGIDVTIDVDLDSDEIAAEVGVDDLGWVVREGVTNIVRHSAAEHVTITVRRHHGRINLVIRNDGAPARGPSGSGLDGLAARIAARGGTLVAGQADDWFRLAVDIPVARPGGGAA